MSKDSPDNSTSQWFVYIIRASDNSLYTGVTTNVERRFNEHRGSPRAARFFRGRQPLEVVYTEPQLDRGSAQSRESEIKKLSRGLKLELIAANRD